ncbi:hypothetical protein FXV83_13040 [Bradyrhizobium hipponense]|uniref:Uncharacterized protein n=2 Tax=Bradyrhizobium hipponense TaxID=2605638 RepID=A0A5S4YNX5_9BRAD|nr:hypothetical protein FXV83_13040 [Bradyrhizobium hipponense]
MELLLDAVESREHDVDGLIDAQVAGNKIKYQTLATRVDHAYASAGLVYDAAQAVTKNGEYVQIEQKRFPVFKASSARAPEPRREFGDDQLAV